MFYFYLALAVAITARAHAPAENNPTAAHSYKKDSHLGMYSEARNPKIHPLKHPKIAWNTK